ncbi:MAG TPA: hypothetical protein VFR51_13770, partial [Pyrinomonadaceae bacterium]|nr:hypothetical protein [Pyrinomonadaceae bacterium]
LINISNDGYLGPTAVMRQHLANTIFRAVENGRPLLRITNTGLSAWIGPDGNLFDQTRPFETDVRIWPVTSAKSDTFYTRHGDLFVYICAGISAILLVALFIGSRRSFRDLR